jgi:thioredoxin reductase (NADPH)
MSDYSSYLVYAIPLLAAMWMYVVQQRRRDVADRSAFREAEEAGLLEPPSLHPVVDAVKCMGSGACAKACPERALGVVGGKALLVNPSACIGHGACAEACPVQAIRLVFGTERRGIELPKVNPDFESNVAGLFIAGELGGMGLIRKAAEQGRQAIESIASRGKGRAPLDLVIVGAGPAGLAASLGAKEKGLKYLTLEQEDNLGGSILHYPRAKIAMTAPVKLPIVGTVKWTDISKEALMEFWARVVKEHRLPVKFSERVEALSRVAEGWEVRSTKSVYRATSVLLALGRRGTPRKLGVEGEELSKVVYRVLDPDQYTGQRVIVVGGGDSALEAALAIALAPRASVVLSYRGDAFSRVKAKNRRRIEESAGAGRLRVMLGSKVKRIEPGEVTLEHKGRDVTLGNDTVVVCAGGELPTPMLKSAGVAIAMHRGEAAG